MRLEINIENYSTVKKKLVKSLKTKIEKKNKEFDVNNIKFICDFGMRFGNMGAKVEQSSIASISASHGRFISTEHDIEVQEVADYFEDIEESERKTEELKTNKETFFSTVLDAVGKENNFGTDVESPCVMNGNDFLKFINETSTQKPIVYPTLDDIIHVESEVYKTYLDKADGKTLIKFAPGDGDCDEFGFKVFDVITAYTKNDKTIFLCSGSSLNNFETYNEDPDSLVWIFQQNANEYKKASNSKPGKFTFSGTECVKLTNEKINIMIKDKIFNNGGVDISRQMTSGVNDFGGGLMGISF